MRPIRATFVSLALSVLVLTGGARSARAQGDTSALAPTLPAATSSSLNAFTGVTVIDGDPYWRVDLRPDFRFGRVGIGMKAVLLVGQPSGDDPDADTKTKLLTEDGEEWDSLGSYLRAIRYIEWATPRAPFYARYGELFDVRVGHGMLMEGYSNFDRRGARLNLDRGSWGAETMLNNFDKPELFGGRAFIRPLAGTESLLNRLTLGATALVDINPVPDADGAKSAGITDEDPLIAYAGDAAFPLVRSESMLLELYNEVAATSLPSISDAGELTTEAKMGDAVGIGLDVASLRAKLEYRTMQAGFVPTLFGYDYEYLARTPDHGIWFDPTRTATNGYYGSATMSYQEKAFVGAIFEDYNGDGPDGDPRLSARFVETTLLEPVDVRAFYTKRGIGGVDSKNEEQSFFEDLVDLDEKSLFVVEIAYNIQGPMQLVLTREYRFRERADGEGFEPIKKTTAQIGISTSF